MAKGDQINLRPHFRKEGPTLPCEGEVGDLFVFTPLEEGERDPTPQGLASLWFCTKGSEENGKRNAVWARVSFDGTTTCAAPPPNPPNYPDLPKQG
jgi:hypothetical protein